MKRPKPAATPHEATRRILASSLKPRVTVISLPTPEDVTDGRVANAVTPPTYAQRDELLRRINELQNTLLDTEKRLKRASDEVATWKQRAAIFRVALKAAGKLP